jgi:glycosyltransferase involved in cell wall biosynthesis
MGRSPVELPALPLRPLISVLVSCRNYQQFVGDCIQSVLDQSYDNFELIVCDDGSDDASASIIETSARKDARVRLITQPHRGMAASLNSAWEASTGEIICLLDADDVFHREKLRLVVESFLSHPRVGMVIHRALRTDIRGRGRGVLPLFGRLPSGWCFREIFEQGGILPDFPPTSNMALRREVAEAIFPLPEEYRGFAERVIHRLAPFITEIHGIDRALATWRLHGRNDANAEEVIACRTERDVQVMEQLWYLQRAWLRKTVPDLAGEFPGLKQNDYYCRLRLVLARLNRSPTASQLYRELLDCPGFARRPLIERWFWKVTRCLPDSLFRAASNFIMTQGMTKQMVSRVLRIGR